MKMSDYEKISLKIRKNFLKCFREEMRPVRVVLTRGIPGIDQRSVALWRDAHNEWQTLTVDPADKFQAVIKLNAFPADRRNRESILPGIRTMSFYATPLELPEMAVWFTHMLRLGHPFPQLACTIAYFRAVISRFGMPGLPFEVVYDPHLPGQQSLLGTAPNLWSKFPHINSDPIALAGKIPGPLPKPENSWMG
jgi:hypothetical protein